MKQTLLLTSVKIGVRTSKLHVHLAFCKLMILNRMKTVF